ncbi:UNVERIFIED_CONTAM: transposase family protein, partial [Salmonella enterica subsp. enterica serovar Weltevreden]
KYYILFLDDFSNYLWTVPIANKNIALPLFQNFHTLIKTQFGISIKNLQYDNGKEFDNGPFHNFCTSTGMQFHFSCPYTSSQNGKAERKIKSI